MTLNIKQGIYLAALLHDIGKFWQRGSKYDETLSVQTKNMESDLCPVWNSRYSHKHVLWTSEFFEQYTKYIPQSFNRDGELESIANLSAKHHKKASGQTEWERIISYADRLSSGQDRRPDEIGVDTSGSQQRYDFKKIPLQNIFDNLFKVEESNKQSWHILSPLTTNDDIFAKKSDKLSRDLQPDYENLWKSFTDELPNLPLHNFSQYVSTLLPLLEKYCWCIPSSTIDQPDVSLFDHLKTTAAIATSLYDSIETHGSLPSTYDGMKNENKDRFILLSADFSGIQKFIYQITSKGAAKTLKGRSFYLQLIMDMMITHILEVFDVEKAHILLAGGGGFRLLLPNNETKIKEIENFIDDVNKQ
ncbi:MAG TPA: type III-A CRISPR-associated protein Cas10/Csm1, partial [Balneolales bacterium]|nr:type III-A CRISPR-associated protein Cas10/Csm1 [Balneolales bacterium]